MPDLVQCPVCGEMFPSEDFMVLANGNTACTKCCAEESKEDN